jgi:MurNAc alpha-1-phosphate uridylyltransferase
VGGKALIDHALDKLDSAGVAKAVVNVHYLADALEGHLKVRRNGPAVSISDERERLLETGGGMVKAAAQLPDPFFCLNSDNIWLDGPNDVFAELSQAWNADAMDALLLMVPHPRALNYRGEGDFHLDSVGKVRRRQPGRVAPFIYSGIQVVSHRLLRDAPEGPFSTNLLWSRAIEEGRLYGISHTGLWFEVGEPGAIKPTEAWLPRA